MASLTFLKLQGVITSIPETAGCHH